MTFTKTRLITIALAALFVLPAQPQQSVPETLSDTSNVFRGTLYGFGNHGILTGGDRAGGTGTVSDYYDYNAGLQLYLPLVKGKLFFSGSEQLTGNRTPSGYYAGTQPTAHILSTTDAQAITQYLTTQYGGNFDAGSAGAFSEKRQNYDFNNSLHWQLNEKHRLTLFNHTTLINNRELQRDAQGFRFSSMAYDYVSQSIETGLNWEADFNEQWSAALSAGYTDVNNRRDPLGNANMPQVQIAGRSPGTMIYLGTDREASIYKNDQSVWTFSGEAVLRTGMHELTLATNNKLHTIDYGYMSGWNGRIDYLSIEDFLNNKPYRVRGAYNYGDNNREYLLANPAAQFKLNDFNLSLQDRIEAGDRLVLIPALHVRMVHLPDMPALSKKTEQVWADPNFGTTYTYTPLNRIRNEFLNRIDLLPRLDFTYALTEDENWMLRGGAGLYSGELPFSWLAYLYRHTGDTYGDYSQRADEEPFDSSLDPLKPSENGISDYIAQNGVVIDNANSGTTELNLADNDLGMPLFAKVNLALDFTVQGWNISVEGFVRKTMRDFLWQQVNIKDAPYWYAYDTQHQQPVYKGTVDSRFSGIYLLSNTDKGYAYAFSVKIDKEFANGLFLHADYTYGVEKDLMAGYSASMEANRQLTPALTPNNPELAYSNADIRHRMGAGAGYTQDWGRAGKTKASLSFNAQSGSPFSYGIVNHNLQGSSQYVSLVYIPEADEAVHYFKDEANATAVQQAEAFNKYIDGNDYLKSRRGKFTERNGARTPWNVQADLHLSHKIALGRDKTQSLALTVDVINLTNLLNKEWGVRYYSSPAFNSTASVGLTPSAPFAAMNEGHYPAFTFSEPGTPYSIDYLASRTRLQVGLKYEF